MIRLYNVETEKYSKYPHIGELNTDMLYKQIHKRRKELVFFGDLYDAQVTHDWNSSFQFLTSTWSVCMQEGDILTVSIKSYDYMSQMEELMNKIVELEQKVDAIDQHVGSLIKTAESTISKSPTFKVHLLWASPYAKQVNGESQILKYQTRYDSIFFPIMKSLEGSKKNIKLIAEEFNKANFVTAVERKANILYINAHAEYIYQTMQIFTQTKDGQLQNLLFSQLDLQNDSIDLIILHSSYTEQFSNKIYKIAKNLVVISNNVYSQDDSIIEFLNQFFLRLLSRDSVQLAFEEAFTKVKENESWLKIRCCCFHKHGPFCKRNSIIELKDVDMFARYHKKCHGYSMCDCPDANRLLHEKSCTQFCQRIIPDYIPTETDDNKLNYCCCPEIAQEYFKTTGIDIHSLELKFELKKHDNSIFQISDGEYSCDRDSTLFNQPEFKLVSSRKKYLEQCIKYICMKTKEENKHLLLIHFYGEQNKEELADYLYTILARKKIIQAKKEIFDQNWKIMKKREIIQNNSFLILKENIKILDDILETSSISKTKVIVLISQKRMFLPPQVMRVQFQKRTKQENLVGYKRTTSFDPLPFISRLESSKSPTTPTDLSSSMMKQYQRYWNALQKVNSDVLNQIKASLQLYEFFVILAHFGSVSESTINLVIAKVSQNQRGAEENAPFKSYIGQILIQLENQEYKMKPCYSAVFQLCEKFEVTKYTTIEHVCYKYLFQVLLTEALKFPKIGRKKKQMYRLFEATTLNKFSILSLYLKEHREYLQSEDKPIITPRQMFSFIESMIELKIKASNHDFQLMVILALNSKLVTIDYTDLVDYMRIREEVWEIEKIIHHFEDPIFGSIFLQLLIQLRLESMESAGTPFINKIISKLNQCQKLISSEFADKVYKYIIDFDILMGHLMVYSSGWKPITETNHQNILKQCFNLYQKSRAAAFSSKKDHESFEEIAHFHGFKLNFLKVLVNNNRFEFIYKNLLEVPTKATKDMYRGLWLYLELFHIHNTIKTVDNHPLLCKIDTFWKLYQQLIQKYKDHSYLKLFQSKLKQELLTKIKEETKKVCCILRSFPIKNKDDRTVIVDYNLAGLLRQNNLIVRQFSLNRINLADVLTKRCKYLVLWFEGEAATSDGKEKISCDIESPKEDFYLQELFKEIENANFDADFPILTCIVCSTNWAFSWNIIKTVNQLFEKHFKGMPTKSINLVGFDFRKLEHKQSMEESIYIRKLIMNIFTQNFVKQDMKNESSIFEVISRVESGVKKRLSLAEDFVQLDYKPRGGFAFQYLPIEILNIDHTYYKGQMQQVIQILKSMVCNQEGEKFMRYNIIGQANILYNFLNFFQMVCKNKEILFAGGVYRINCSTISRDALPLEFIEKRLDTSLICLRNKRALIILENFDFITKEIQKRQTYEYLMQLITDDTSAISIVASSEKPIDGKFKKTTQKVYKRMPKAIDYEKKIIHNPNFAKSS